MTMTEEWCCEKLKCLEIKKNRLSTLSEICGRLSDTPNLETKVTARLLSSPEIYDCLEEDDQEGVGTNSAKPEDLVSDILSICMANLTLRQSNLPQLLHRALLHKRPRIRALALNTILKELQNQIGYDSLDDAISDELLRHILSAVQEPETQLGGPALAILSLVLESRLEQRFVKDSLLHALKQNEDIKCRIYELAANLAKRSAANLEKVEFILDHALVELDNDNKILQADILETLFLLAEQSHGILYLDKRRVFDVIEKQFEKMEQNPVVRHSVPLKLKFFGKTASVQPQEIINGYPRMILCLFKCFNSKDISILQAAFETLANLTQSQQGVLLLEQNYGNAIKYVFDNCASYVRDLQPYSESCAFDSLEQIFTFESSVSPEISAILQRWFNCLNKGSNNMQFLMDFCRNSYWEARTSSYNLIRSLCLYSWGIEAFKNTAGFLEYLLDRRRVEGYTNSEYARFNVVKLLAESNAFDVQTNIQLRNYVHKGPSLC